MVVVGDVGSGSGGEKTVEMLWWYCWGIGGGGCSKRKNLRKSELTELLRKGIFFEITRNGYDIIYVIT